MSRSHTKSTITISEIENEIITGEKFQSIANWTFITQSILNFHTSIHKHIPYHKYIFLDKINPTDLENHIQNIINTGDILFIYSSIIDMFVDMILPLLEKYDKTIILLSHNSDEIIRIDNINHRRIIESSVIYKWYTQNNSTTHSKVVSVPIGLANS
jgi:hypothetical protein